MSTRVYESGAFRERVQYAKQCMLTDRTGSREFDTCFEMFDGSLVMVRLLQDAEKDQQLREKLERYAMGWSRLRLYPLLKDKGPHEIEDLAQTLRDRFHGDVRAMWPDLVVDD